MSPDWKRSLLPEPWDTGLEVRCAGLERQGWRIEDNEEEAHSWAHGGKRALAGHCDK